jgi:arginyl-tRNA synthetase
MHVAKTMWAIVQKLGGENPEKLSDIDESRRSDWMSEDYVTGSNAYEDNEQAKQQIVDLNKKIYAIHDEDDKQSKLAQIYWICRQWSYDYYDSFYAQIGTHFCKILSRECCFWLRVRYRQ